jgi:hypothetical protein
MCGMLGIHTPQGDVPAFSVGHRTTEHFSTLGECCHRHAIRLCHLLQHRAGKVFGPQSEMRPARDRALLYVIEYQHMPRSEKRMSGELEEYHSVSQGMNAAGSAQRSHWPWVGERTPEDLRLIPDRGYMREDRKNNRGRGRTWIRVGGM